MRSLSSRVRGGGDRQTHRAAASITSIDHWLNGCVCMHVPPPIFFVCRVDLLLLLFV